MKYLKIKNDGLLDVRLISLMGGTTKADDKFKIGQFGTGLKYTLSYLLRNNLDFKIFIGGEEQKITIIQDTVRDTTFEIICINGEKTSITTNMGKEWEAWMIIRELWCNALDEENGNYSVVESENIIPEKHTTEYYIQLTSDIQKVWDNWHTLFLHEQNPIFENDKFALYDGGDKLRIYKNGVLIKKFDHKGIFAYDIKNATINEMREFNGGIACEISYILPYMNENAINIFLNNIKGTFEEQMDYNWGTSVFNDDWKKAIGNSKFIDYDTYKRILDKNPEISEQPIIQVPRGLFEKLIKYFPSISMLRGSSYVNSFYETYSSDLLQRVEVCRGLLEMAGYYLDPQLKIIIGVFGNTNVIAQVDLYEKEIRLSQDLEVKSDFDLMYALVEENEHFRTGFNDLTRNFQTHFIELYTNLLLKRSNVSTNKLN